MSHKVRCQSCGMPLAEESAIKQMTEEFGMPTEQATELANSFIPTLKRWL